MIPTKRELVDTTRLPAPMRRVEAPIGVTTRRTTRVCADLPTLTETVAGRITRRDGTVTTVAPRT